MEKNSKIYVAGHAGLVGSAITQKLQSTGFHRLITRTKDELDLRNQHDVTLFFKKERPDFVFLTAARVGGILANINNPASFIYDNLAIAFNVIHAAYENNVKKLLFFGSSCVYPRSCPQPIREDYLMTGPLEPTNSAYAIAKIAGLSLCQAYNTQYGTQFISCMPTNLYGPGDTFDDQNSHVIPALIKRIYQASITNSPSVTIWGSGTPYREFLFIDDVARAALFLMERYTDLMPINIGTGDEITISDLAYLIKKIIGYPGKLTFDTQKPDGVPRKQLNSDRITTLGWQPEVSLEQGLKKTIAWYMQSQTDWQTHLTPPPSPFLQDTL